MYFTKNQQKIYYQVYGNGPKTFVLIHNSGGSHEFFGQQIDFLKSLGTVIAFDLLGHGMSDKGNHFTLSNHAQDIIDLCQFLQIKKFIPIGLNIGAIIAIEIVNLSPEKIQKLILIDPPIFMEKETAQGILDHIYHLENNSIEEYLDELIQHSFIKTTEENKTIAKKAFRIAATNSITGLTSHYKDLLDWDKNAAEKIKKITIPTLCITTDSKLCNTDLLQSHYPEIQIIQVKNSLYWATLEVPDQINHLIKQFV